MIGKTIFVIAVLGATIASAQVADSETSDVSPFATPSIQVNNGPAVQPAAPTSLDQFQFNGIMVMYGKVRISLFDSKENKSFWIHQGQLGEYGVSFQRFDEDNETVVIAQGGIQKKLALNKVKIEPLQISQNRPAPMVTSAPVRPQVNGNTESDEEARARIQRVAEEIRRRRAERRKQLEDRSGGATN